MLARDRAARERQKRLSTGTEYAAEGRSGRGTGSLSYSGLSNHGGMHECAVTAKHLVPDKKPTWLRHRRWDGGVADDDEVLK